MRVIVFFTLAVLLISLTATAVFAATPDSATQDNATADTATPDYNLNIKDNSLNWVYVLVDVAAVVLVLTAGIIAAKKIKYK